MLFDATKAETAILQFVYHGWTKDANGNHERLIMNASLWLAETLTATNPSKKEDKIQVSFLRKGNDCYITGFTWMISVIARVS